MPSGNSVQQTGISKKLSPGQPGTKRYMRQFGAALVCVRYRTHPETATRYTTVEIVVDEKQRPKSVLPGGIEETTPVAVTVAFGETDLRQRVKQAGGKWDQERKIWLLPYGIARKLGLHGRIRKLGADHAWNR